MFSQAIHPCSQTFFWTWIFITVLSPRWPLNPHWVLKWKWLCIHSWNDCYLRELLPMRIVIYCISIGQGKGMCQWFLPTSIMTVINNSNIAMVSIMVMEGCDIGKAVMKSAGVVGDAWVIHTSGKVTKSMNGVAIFIMARKVIWTQLLVRLLSMSIGTVS